MKVLRQFWQRVFRAKHSRHYKGVSLGDMARRHLVAVEPVSCKLIPFPRAPRVSARN